MGFITKKLFYTFILTLIFLSFILPPIEATTAEEWFIKAYEYGELGQYENAIEAYDNSLAIDPHNAATWTNRGHTLYKLGRYEEAIESYNKALEINPWKTSTLYFKGNALRRLGRFEEAIEIYDKVLEIDPENPSALYYKGYALRQLERYEQAIEAFDKALEIDPDYLNAWLEKGYILKILERYKEAIDCYDEVLELDPEHGNTWYDKGYALIKLRRYPEALESFNKTLEIDPENVNAWNNKALILTQLRRDEEAIECYNKALDIDPENAYAWDNKADALIRLKKYEDLLNFSEKALEIDPENVEALNYKGLALLKLRRLDEAEESFNTVIEINPENVEARNMLENIKELRVILTKHGMYAPDYYRLQSIVIISIFILIGIFASYRIFRMDQITAMRVANISGGILSIFLLPSIGIYLLYSNIDCTPKYIILIIPLLMLGVISTTLFSYLYLDHFKRKPEQFVCSLLPGSLISLMCIVSGLTITIISIYLVHPIFEVIWWEKKISLLVLLGCGPTYVGILSASLFAALIGILILILGVNSAFILAKNKGKVPAGLEQWKIRGLQLGTLILAAGIVASGLSSVSDPESKTDLSYSLEIDTEKEVTLLLPVPVDESNQTIFNVDDLHVKKGAPDLNIVETIYGKALEIQTDTATHIKARKNYGFKDAEEIDKLYSSINFSMLTTVNRKHSTKNYSVSIYRIWVFSSKPDTDVKIRLFLESECGEYKSYTSYRYNLKEGWQEINIFIN